MIGLILPQTYVAYISRQMYVFCFESNVWQIFSILCCTCGVGKQLQCCTIRSQEPLISDYDISAIAIKAYIKKTTQGKWQQNWTRTNNNKLRTIKMKTGRWNPPITLRKYKLKPTATWNNKPNAIRQEE